MEYVSAKEASKRLGCTPRWIQMLCDQNKIQGAQKLSGNGVWLIPEKWVAEIEKEKGLPSAGDLDKNE